VEIKEYDSVYFEDVYDVVHTTIEKIYTKYYPRSAVDFYHNYHSKENMEKNISNEHILVLIENNKIFGTGAVSGNEIKRFFILPEYQGNGYGRILFEKLENNINDKIHEKYFLYASLASVNFYLKNNYKYKSFNKYELPDGKYLCYFEMEKSINKMIDIK